MWKWRPFLLKVHVWAGRQPARTVTHLVLIAKPSKSAKKRENLALQALGERLLTLNAQQLASIDMDDALVRAVASAAKIRSRGALRRQKQLIGKLMRHVDVAPIEAALAKLDREDQHDKRAFREAERWRERLLSNDSQDGVSAHDQLEEVVGRRCPEVRQAVSNWRSANSEARRKHAYKQVFRTLHEALLSDVQKSAHSG